MGGCLRSHPVVECGDVRGRTHLYRKVAIRDYGGRPGEVLATRLHVFNISVGFSGLQLITRTFLNFFVYFAIALHYCAMIRLVHGSPKSPTGVGLKPHVHLFLIINQEEGTAQCPPTPN